MAGKSGKVSAIIALDVIGFALVFMGAGMIRFVKDEILSVVGGFVLAAGVAILSVTRLMQK